MCPSPPLPSPPIQTHTHASVPDRSRSIGEEGGSKETGREGGEIGTVGDTVPGREGRASKDA